MQVESNGFVVRSRGILTHLRGQPKLLLSSRHRSCFRLDRDAWSNVPPGGGQQIRLAHFHRALFDRIDDLLDIVVRMRGREETGPSFPDVNSLLQHVVEEEVRKSLLPWEAEEKQ